MEKINPLFEKILSTQSLETKQQLVETFLNGLVHKYVYPEDSFNQEKFRDKVALEKSLKNDISLLLKLHSCLVETKHELLKPLPVNFSDIRAIGKIQAIAKNMLVNSINERDKGLPFEMVKFYSNAIYKVTIEILLNKK